MLTGGVTVFAVTPLWRLFRVRLSGRGRLCPGAEVSGPGRHRHAAQQTPSAAANHALQASVSQPTRPYPAPSRSRHRPYILCGTIWMTPRQVTIDDRSTLPQGCPTAGEDR